MQEQSPEVGFRPEGSSELVARTSELEFRRLLEKLPAGAYTCDPQGLITYYNQHAVELWGRSPKLNDAVDRFCGSFKLFSPDGAPIAHNQCWMALALHARKEYNGHEIVIERPNGDRLTVLAHANPIHDESGELLGAVNVLVDITDRKRAETALKEADRFRNEFLAVLAHELRNPLAPVRNAVQILHLQGMPSPDSLAALNVIDRQITQMARLIDDLLDVARITGNKLELRKERVELGGIVRTAIETSRPLIDAGKHELTVSVPTHSVVVDADPARLAQVVSNLLNNAARFTDEGGHIELSAEQQGSDIVVSVRDNGIGIPLSALPTIFEMFRQVEGPREHADGSLGVGLALVKRLVDLHEGSVIARSDGPGKGSEFIVRLPVVADAKCMRQQERQEDAATTSAITLRILVVDDNRDAVTTLLMLLRLMGYSVASAADGMEALSVASEFQPDIVLLDIGLPKVNGYEAAKRIREQPWGKEMLLIAVTGWGQPADMQRSIEAGFDHHLLKPVDPAALVQLMTTMAVRNRRATHDRASLPN